MSILRRLPPLFYLGLFPVVVLLWAWADSTNHETYWHRCWKEWRVEHRVELRGSALHFLHTRVEGMPSPSFEALAETGKWGRIHRAPLRGATATFFPPPRDETRSEKPFPHIDLGMSYLIRERILPLWVILLGYLPPWLLQVWWQARQKRKEKLEG